MFWDFPLWEGDARGKKSDLGEPFRRIRHIRRRPVGAQQVDPLGEAFHLTADVRMGNIRIDLRRAYILMSKQFTDGFDGYSRATGGAINASTRSLLRRVSRKRSRSKILQIFDRYRLSVSGWCIRWSGED